MFWGVQVQNVLYPDRESGAPGTLTVGLQLARDHRSAAELVPVTAAVGELYDQAAVSPDDLEPEAQPSSEDSGLSRRQKLLAGTAVAAATVLLGLVITDVYNRIVHPPVPSPEQQLEQIVGRLSDDDWDVSLSKAARFGSDGSPVSRVLVLHPSRPRPEAGDRVLIYRADKAGRLKKSFEFSPTSVSAPDFQDDQRLRRVRLAIAKDTVQFRNFDGAPGVEMLFEVSQVEVERRHFSLMLLVHLSGKQALEVSAVLGPSSTGLQSLDGPIVRGKAQPGSYADILIRSVYLQPTRITYRSAEGEDRVLRAFASEVAIVRKLKADQTVAAPRGRLRLRAGYIVGDRGFGTADKLQIIDWDVQIDSASGSVKASAIPLRIVDVGKLSSKLKSLLSAPAR